MSAMKKLNQRKIRRTQPKRRSNTYDYRQPFVEHLYELRKRLLYIVLSIILFSLGAYFVQQHIVSWLLKPSHNQQFIYTSPGGGINFLFQVCMYVGITCSIPVILHQLLRFLEPIVNEETRSRIIRYSFFSALLAAMGAGFGYFIGLPVALHFLGSQFTTTRIHALFTIQEYMSFVTVYLIGSALFFQLPIIIMFINRMKSLTPKRLFGLERYVIVAAFVVAMIMAPTPNIINQFIIAGPIIAIYQVSIFLVWWQNRYSRLPRKARRLLEHDANIQAERFKRVELSSPFSSPSES